MTPVTVKKITERLRHLSPEKLTIIYDFVSDLAKDESHQTSDASIVISLNEYKRLKRLEHRQMSFYEFSSHLRRDLQAIGMDEVEFENDLELTKREVFAERYGKSPQ